MSIPFEKSSEPVNRVTEILTVLKSLGDSAANLLDGN